MVVSFYVRIIVYVGITFPAIPSDRIAKSRQFSMGQWTKLFGNGGAEHRTKRDEGMRG